MKRKDKYDGRLHRSSYREAVPQKKQPGYYPGYSTLGQKKFWDATTRELVEKRVNEVPPIRFFAGDEIAIMAAVCDRILPQDDRLPGFRVPILHSIDERLFLNQTDGYRYEGMPSDQEAYRLAIRAIDETARSIHGEAFPELDSLKQDFLLKSISEGKQLGAREIWRHVSLNHFWSMLVSDCVKAYYSHPWAWDEIGYGGPAYPRAYMRLEGGLPEPWEVDEVRYEWEAPRDSISDQYSEESAPEGQSRAGRGRAH